MTTTDPTTGGNTTDGTVTDETTVTVTVRVDDVVELFELLAFCRALCRIAPEQINAAMAKHVVNGYHAAALGADLEALSRRLYQAMS
jgi:hypothetical protein